MTTATETKTVAGEIKDPSVKGRVLEYLVHLKSEARRPDTLKSHRKVLNRLAKHGAWSHRGDEDERKEDA